MTIMAVPLTRRQKNLNHAKVRPKSCEIISAQSEWKTSFENRKSVFEQGQLSSSNQNTVTLQKDSQTTELNLQVRIILLMLMKIS